MGLLLPAQESRRLGKGHDGLTYRRENTPGHLHPLGFIIPHGGACVVITLLRPVPGEEEESSWWEVCSRTSPGGLSCPHGGWVLACLLLVSSQAGSGLPFTSDGAPWEISSKALHISTAFDSDCIQGELMLPFCHFLSLISQLGLNTGRLLAGLVTLPNTSAPSASGLG